MLQSWKFILFLTTFPCRERLSSSLADHEELLSEHDQLASRHEKLLLESEEAKETLQRQMRMEVSRNSAQRQEQAELIVQLRQEIEEVTNAFKSQLHSLQEDHHKVRGQLEQRAAFLKHDFVHVPVCLCV